MKNNKSTNEKSDKMHLLISFFLFIVLILSVLTAVTIGSTDISIPDVYNVNLHNVLDIFGVDYRTQEFGSGPIHDVVWFIRLPRIILAIAVGMGLSICGVVMQAIVKNPLADPYILGVSSGASFGATLAIMLGVGAVFGANSIGIMGFLGAFTISILVLVISNIGGRGNSIKLLLAGMALSSVCSAISSFIVYFAHDKEGMMNITYWLMGSLAGATWDTNLIVLLIVIVCTLFFWSQHRIFNLMLLGDEVAITLGTDLHKFRYVYLLISSIIIGFVVYSSGMIGFVGLIIPHIVRMIFGTDHKKLIPISALIGSIFLIWADVLSRIIIPNSELPIGILISIIGSPCFVYLMIKKPYGFGGAK